MKLINKKKYPHPELIVIEVDKMDILGVSSDAYDDDVFEPTSLGGQGV